MGLTGLTIKFIILWCKLLVKVACTFFFFMANSKKFLPKQPIRARIYAHNTMRARKRAGILRAIGMAGTRYVYIVSALCVRVSARKICNKQHFYLHDLKNSSTFAPDF